MTYEEEGYWRDVGTISAFFDTHMDMLGEKLSLSLITLYGLFIHPAMKVLLRKY